MTADEIIARLVAALQDVEFVVRGEYSVPTCASCGGLQTCGHDIGCLVREALAAAEAYGKRRQERPPVQHASDCNLSLPPSQAAYGVGCTCGAQCVQELCSCGRTGMSDAIGKARGAT